MSIEITENDATHGNNQQNKTAKQPPA